MSTISGTEGQRFLTVEETAELLRVSRTTAYRLVHTAEIPSVRVGNQYRVPAAELEHELKEKR